MNQTSEIMRNKLVEISKDSELTEQFTQQFGWAVIKIFLGGFILGAALLSILWSILFFVSG